MIYVAVESNVASPASLTTYIYYTGDSGLTWAKHNQTFGVRALCSTSTALIAITTNAAGTDCGISRSIDGGENFVEMYDLTINGFDVSTPDIRQKSGILVYSDNSLNANYSDYIRYLISEDDGVTWIFASSNVPLS